MSAVCYERRLIFRCSRIIFALINGRSEIETAIFSIYFQAFFDHLRRYQLLKFDFIEIIRLIFYLSYEREKNVLVYLILSALTH